MMTFHPPGEKGIDCTNLDICPELTRRSVWIDLFEPTRAEEDAVEAALGMDIPTRQELQEIEPSSRLFVKQDALFMTATVISRADTLRPERTVVTFIVAPDRFVTLRYADPLPFQTFRARREANLPAYATGHQAFVGLIDAIVERLADILENVSADLDHLSEEVFRAEGAPALNRRRARSAGERHRPVPLASSPQDFNDILRRIGHSSDLVSRARESLVSFIRLVTFFRDARKEAHPKAGEVAGHPFGHLKAVGGDLVSLSDHATFLSGNVAFLLDATLGMINNEQNRIFKVLSAAAFVVGPPTLIAGIYGMNFERMPELKWAYGYPFALVLMAVSAAVPYWWFKRRGWL